MTLLVLGLVLFLGVHSSRVFAEGPRQRFIAQRESERESLAADPKPWSRRVLEHFDTENARLGAFRQCFGLPDFWQWDVAFNSQSFKPNP